MHELLCMLFVHRSYLSPYSGDSPTVSAHPWKPKEQPKPVSKEQQDIETEWDDVLKQASEEELVDLAGNFFTRGNNSKFSNGTT